MKIILVISFAFFFSCKNKIGNVFNSELEMKNKTFIKKNNDEVDISLEYSTCKNSYRDTDLYSKFIGIEKQKYKNSLENNKLFYQAEKEKFDILFEGQNIICILSLSGNGYNIFDLFYDKDRSTSKYVYNKILMVNKNRDEALDYHDFFKRGMVFILNERVNKITIVTFNPFLDNSIPAKIKTIFNKNKDYFKTAFMTTGIGTVQNLVQ